MAIVASERPATFEDPREPVERLFQQLRANRAGLSSREAERRLVACGRNELVRRGGRRWPREVAKQVTHPLALLLGAAAGLAFVAGTPVLGAAILAVILLNAERPPRLRSEGVIGRSLLYRAWVFLGAIEAVLVLGGSFFVLLRAGWNPGGAVSSGHSLHGEYLRATTMTFAGIVACQIGTRSPRAPSGPRCARSASSVTGCCSGASPPRSPLRLR